MMMTGITRGIASLGMVLVFGLGSTGAAVALPQGAHEEGILLAAAAPAKESQKNSAPPPLQFLPEEIKKRGAELDNFIYEVFDPNAKDPLADLGKMEMVGEGGRRRLLWIAAGTAILAGAGAAGYLWYNSQPAEPVHLYFNDGN